MWKLQGTPQNLCLTFIDELEKQLFTKKNCWNEPIKDVRISIFKMYSYSSWDIECDRLKLVSMGHLKNAWRYYRFTHEYHKWHHFMYGSWDMECNGHNFLSFWTIFWTFNHLTVWKIKILKKWKNCLKILSFYKCAP